MFVRNTVMIAAFAACASAALPMMSTGVLTTSPVSALLFS
jgi:hypothetical protein